MVPTAKGAKMTKISKESTKWSASKPGPGARTGAKKQLSRLHKLAILGGIFAFAPLWVFWWVRNHSARSLTCSEQLTRDAGNVTRGEFAQPWMLNPAVHEDPFFANAAYPDPERLEVQNALHVASLVREVLDIRGFEVYDNGHFIGQLPEYYMGFPKAGTTTAYSFMESRLCCMAKKLNKEPHFWYVHFNPHCVVNNGRLSDCNKRYMKEHLVKYVERSLKSINQLKKGGCSNPYVVDGSTHQMFEPALELHGPNGRIRDVGGDVPFDFAVFLHALTPSAKFIAVIRGA
eukprot:2053939-Rhodomonas_salina.1